MLWHDWKNAYTIRLKYETMIFESSLGKEQRRGLRTVPLLEISMNVTAVQHTDTQSFLGRQWEYIYAPIEIEGFTGTRGGAGSKTVTITSDVSYYFFLKHISGLYLIDEDGNHAAIVSIVGTTITLDQDIAGTSTDFWPAIKAVTKNANSTLVTSRVLTGSLSLEQVKE